MNRQAVFVGDGSTFVLVLIRTREVLVVKRGLRSWSSIVQANVFVPLFAELKHGPAAQMMLHVNVVATVSCSLPVSLFTTSCSLVHSGVPMSSTNQGIVSILLCVHKQSHQYVQSAN